MNSFKLMYIVYFVIFCVHRKESKTVIFSTNSDFLEVAKTTAFVDKTLLIKTFFYNRRFVLITAPRKFGKSTNLNMLKTFFSIESKNNDKILQTFKSLKIYENNSTFFRDNFATRPVLYLDFKSGKTENYEDALYAFKYAIHNAYLEHKYLIHSQTLYDHEGFKWWCDENSLKQMDGFDITTGLGGLARLLRKHFNKRVVVLIDAYDSIINNALFGLKNNSKFEDLVDLISAVVFELVKDNHDVERAVITGESYISTTGLWRVNTLQTYRFLDDHPFVSFYGLTENEVNELFQKNEFKSQSNKCELATELYNGYLCKRERRIYNTFSFLKFLKTGNAVPHSSQTDYFSGIFNMLKYTRNQIIILSLLKGNNIEIKEYDMVGISDVLELKDMYSESNKTSRPKVDLLWSHLLELGFLTYTEPIYDSGKYFLNWELREVKIANKEVYSIIFTEFKNYYIKKCNLSRTLRSADYSEFVQVLVSPEKFYTGLVEKCVSADVVDAAKRIVKKMYRTQTKAERKQKHGKSNPTLHT